jgi:putative transposase
MIIKRAFRFILKPAAKQHEQFLRFALACRWVFNRGLEIRINAYKAEGKTVCYFEQNVELTKLKKETTTSWLKGIHSQVLQQSLKNLDRAYTNFFRRIKTSEKPGFPCFKKRGIKDSFRFPQGV